MLKVSFYRSTIITKMTGDNSEVVNGKQKEYCECFLCSMKNEKLPNIFSKHIIFGTQEMHTLHDVPTKEKIGFISIMFVLHLFSKGKPIFI